MRLIAHGVLWSGKMSQTSAADSIWAPMRVAIFRALWLAVLVSNIGAWMQTVGA
jgi:hypothetical protein